MAILVGAPIAKALPEKPVIEPNVKMSAIHWNKIQARKVAGTLWEDVDDARIRLNVQQVGSEHTVWWGVEWCPIPFPAAGRAL